MWINVLCGLLIPTVIIGYLFKKKPPLITLLYPIGVATGFVGSDWGFGFFWAVSPVFDHNPSLSAFPYKIGYFPLLACLFGYIKVKEIVKIPLLIFLFTIITTLLELLAVWSGKILYSNGWNIFWTFVIYLVGFIGVSFYIKVLKKYKILR
ncbi:CBO0543 family protein [Halobacillus mangrovi]|uniref:CBO0543 family protein n=1 Tax=Halobacillus mangrovi TaxID=402384 RepID=UPI003D982E74